MCLQALLGCRSSGGHTLRPLRCACVCVYVRARVFRAASILGRVHSLSPASTPTFLTLCSERSCARRDAPTCRKLSPHRLTPHTRRHEGCGLKTRGQAVCVHLDALFPIRTRAAAHGCYLWGNKQTKKWREEEKTKKQTNKKGKKKNPELLSLICEVVDKVLRCVGTWFSPFLHRLASVI